MPDPEGFEKEDDWMEACVSAKVDEGKDQDQAVATCLQMWKDKSVTMADLRDLESTLKAGIAAGGAVELPMLLTKADRMADGRIRWQARANTGEWDLERERFSSSFWDDVVHNFARVQEALARSETPPDKLPVPILDIAHYSFRLPKEKRNMARVGVVTRVWKSGDKGYRDKDLSVEESGAVISPEIEESASTTPLKAIALYAQGFFDNTPLGKAAAIAAQKRPVEDRRVSIGVWPDWGLVKLDAEGRRIYEGGRGRAYLDHLAMTGSPVDPGTILEVKSMTQKQDALDVLGEDAVALVNELEEATIGKAIPAAAIVKAEECTCSQPEQKAEGEGNAEAITAPVGVDTPKPEKQLTMRELKEVLSALFNTFGKSIDERMAPIEAGLGKIEAIEARVNALAATETEKVKAAVDSPSGDWLTEMIKKSVQRQQPVKGAEPEQAVDTSDPFYRVFGGLKPK